MVQATRVRFIDEANPNLHSFMDKGLKLPTQRTFKDSGAMVAPAVLARTGIMQYLAKECGAAFADMDPNAVVNIMTRPEDLFDPESLASYHAAPITIGHPDDDVSIDNAKDLQRGHLDGIPIRDGDDLTGQIVLTHAEAVDLVGSGEAEELSSGHDAIVVRVTDEEAKQLGYHAYKTNIRCNHFAIVRKGRAGNARIADEQVKMFDQAFVDGLQAKLDAAEESARTSEAKLADAVKAHGEQLEAMVKEQVEFRLTLAKLSDADFTGMSMLEAKRVVLKDAGIDLEGKSDDYVKIRFDIFLEDAAKEDADDSKMAQALRDAATHQQVPIKKEPPKPSPAEEARQRMIDRHSHK